MIRYWLLLCALVALVPSCTSATCSAIFGDTITDQIHSVVGTVIPPAIGDPLCDANLSNVPSTSWGPPDGIDEQGAQVRTCLAGQPCTTIKVCATVNGDTSCNTCAKTSCCAQIASAYVAARNCAAAGDDACDQAGTQSAYNALTSCVETSCSSKCAGVVVGGAS